MTLAEPVRATIETHLKNNRIVVFMKGRRGMPQCGFSARVLTILEELGQEFQAVNVLESPELREGIKAYANWPTIPQVYVDGKFVGGCDIVGELYASGELHKMLGVEFENVEPPVLKLTETAAEALRGALEDGGAGASIRFAVDAQYQPLLDLGPAQPSDIEVLVSGVRFAVARASAKKVNGALIDFVPGEHGGFRIENPNEPARVRDLTSTELRAWMSENRPFEFIDVRTVKEREMASIPGTKLLDDDTAAYLDGLDRSETVLVFHCHHGGRSLAAGQHYVQRGFKRVFNLKGGIDAWALEVDNTIPRY
ncbi:MAG: Grx4 family monothiol glutaredoxin [Deltaproteobacteria bacterium]|nr:Grx4 family monothiol glutaredoxin [Deltaproteobacteria bacterium]